MDSWPINLKKEVEKFEKTLIVRAMNYTRNNRKHAAAALTMDRTTLQMKLRRFQLVEAMPSSFDPRIKTKKKGQQ